MHPLASAEGQALYASSGLTVDEFLAAVEFSVGAEYLEDGTVIERSGVRWADAEPTTEAAPAEPTAPTAPWIDEELERQLALPEAERPVVMDVWLRLRASEWNRGDDPTQARWKALIEGRIATVADEREVRAEALALRTAAGEAALDVLVDELAVLGAEIVGLGQYLCPMVPGCLGEPRR